jgi:hypothetical protein
VEKLKKFLHKLKMMMMDQFNLNHKCLIPEFIKVFNRIILLTIFLEVLKEGNYSFMFSNFCGHYSFVSSLEPLKVDEALDDPDWVIAMQEELNNFTRNEVWELVERPKQNVIGTKWVFLKQTR